MPGDHRSGFHKALAARQPDQMRASQTQSARSGVSRIRCGLERCSTGGHAPRRAR